MTSMHKSPGFNSQRHTKLNLGDPGKGWKQEDQKFKGIRSKARTGSVWSVRASLWEKIKGGANNSKVWAFTEPRCGDKTYRETEYVIKECENI